MAMASKIFREICAVSAYYRVAPIRGLHPRNYPRIKVERWIHTNHHVPIALAHRNVSNVPMCQVMLDVAVIKVVPQQDLLYQAATLYHKNCLQVVDMLSALKECDDAERKEILIQSLFSKIDQIGDPTICCQFTKTLCSLLNNENETERVRIIAAYHLSKYLWLVTKGQDSLSDEQQTIFNTLIYHVKKAGPTSEGMEISLCIRHCLFNPARVEGQKNKFFMKYIKEFIGAHNPHETPNMANGKPNFYYSNPLNFL